MKVDVEVMKLVPCFGNPNIVCTIYNRQVVSFLSESNRLIGSFLYVNTSYESRCREDDPLSIEKKNPVFRICLSEKPGIQNLRTFDMIGCRW
jgi:hypothetical protein